MKADAILTRWAKVAEGKKRKPEACRVCELPAEYRKAVEQSYETGISRSTVQACLKAEGFPDISVYFIKNHQAHVPAKKAAK